MTTTLREASRLLPERDDALWQDLLSAAPTALRLKAWMELQCRSIPSAVGGIVLLGTSDSGAFAPAALWPATGKPSGLLTACAARALRERRAAYESLASSPGAGPARGASAIARPIEIDGSLRGVVAVELSNEPQADLEDVRRALDWGAGWLEALLQRQEASGHDDASERYESVLRLLGSALEHEQFGAAATALVTDLATRLGCDRVSLGLANRGRITVRAVSHSAHFGKGANLVRAIEAAMEEALDRSSTVVYPAPVAPETVPPVFHESLAREAGSGALCSVLLARGEDALGVLTLERPAERPFGREEIELCEALAFLAGPLLELQRREDRWLISKASDGFRIGLEQLVGPRHAALKLGTVVAVAVCAILLLAKGDYRVTADAELEASELRVAVAAFDGFIAEGKVRAGDLVRAGQELGSLDDRELRLETMKWSSQYEQLVRQHRQALSGHEAADVVILEAQLDQARAQMALLEDQLARIKLVSPLDGVVVKGDLTQELGAPVERGQVLFEIAPLDAYRVVLQVDERQVADVEVGQRGVLVLASLTDESLEFAVTNVTAVALAEEGHNYFRVEGVLDDTPERLRPGMEGVGKVQAGRRRLAWIWTREIQDWLRLALWAWLP